MINGKVNGKVVIVGAGTVGATIAYSVVLSELASEVVLIDVNKNKAMGEAEDINHGLAYVKQMKLKAGDYEDCKGADVVIIAAGIGRKPGQTRLDLAKINISILKDVISNVVKYTKDSVILVVANPVDILTFAAQKLSGLPKTQVFGTGTAYDTARLRYFISTYCNVDVTNVHAYMIGEHGDSQVPVWSNANIAGKKFDDFLSNLTPEEREAKKADIVKEVKTAGGKTIALKGMTNYGIALTVMRILKAILGNENSIIPVSSVRDGLYGVSGVSLSLPSVINAKGISQIFEVNLTDEEKAALKQSEKKLKEVLDQVM